MTVWFKCVVVQLSIDVLIARVPNLQWQHVYSNSFLLQVQQCQREAARHVLSIHSAVAPACMRTPQ